ncbi:hypothetical protein F1C16_20400 (plasmid) [Hymenobacter sp. NBH84]|uniref:hypothetical protein n=1 Tax=Hymenobacter sp. NBH84 TaxID=2596915 RepID=UPI00162AA44C|nr:hypothetical protein [Hymenobacter sp. NBH84]QNE41989.1 hypothetical protein F1C16_20400 [Hymenobacter sp. NBH84]
MRRSYQACLTAASLLVSACAVHPPPRHPGYSITIKAASNYYADYLLHVTREADRIQLRFGQFDSLRTTILAADPAIQALQAVIKAGNLHTLPAAERDTLHRRAMAAEECNTVYTWDRLPVTIPPTHRFAQLLDSVYASSVEQLERHAENRKGIILDGIHFSIVLQGTDRRVKKVQVHSPRPDSHPLVYRLIHESLQLYREQRPDDIRLDVRHTWGY